MVLTFFSRIYLKKINPMNHENQHNKTKVRITSLITVLNKKRFRTNLHLALASQEWDLHNSCDFLEECDNINIERFFLHGDSVNNQRQQDQACCVWHGSIFAFSPLTHFFIPFLLPWQHVKNLKWDKQKTKNQMPSKETCLEVLLSLLES